MRYPFAAIALVLFATACGASPSARPVTPLVPASPASLPALHVSGNRIVNPQGVEVRLRGVNLEDPYVLNHCDFDGDGDVDPHFAEVDTDFVRIASLGANVVRVRIYPGVVSQIGIKRYFEDYLDRMVDLAERNRMYVVIDYHVIGEPDGWCETGSDSYYVDGFVGHLFDSDWKSATAFWEAAAARYGKRSHVVFEIWNEPAAENDELFTWAKWRPFGERLNRIIRQRSRNLIIAPGPHWTSDLSEVPTSPYSDTNLAYAAHIYPNMVDPSEKDPGAVWNEKFGFLAKTYPIVVSEWGFDANSEDEVTRGTLAEYGRPFMEYMETHRISWMAFKYDPIGTPSMVELDWTTPTEFGRFVRESLARKQP